MVDRIHFELFGLELQEPMAFIFNWLIAILCFVSYYKLKNSTGKFAYYWRSFFLIFGLSTVIGGLSHLFYGYWGFYGKYPVWILGALAVFMSSVAMLQVETMSAKKKQFWIIFLMFKGIAAIVFAIIYLKFIFIAVDAAIGYIFFCMVYGIVLNKRGYNVQLFIWGVAVLIPSIVFYVGKISIGKWMNEQDIGHIFMFATIYLFYLGVQSYSKNPLKEETIKAS